MEEYPTTILSTEFMFKKCEKGLCGAVVELKLVACLKFCLANIICELDRVSADFITKCCCMGWGQWGDFCRYIVHVHNRCCMHECFHLMSIVVTACNNSYKSYKLTCN